jgi:NAD(P) transhydrogenase subunit alpha
MVIGLLKEPAYETRVSLLPEHLSILQKLQLKVLVEATAGLNAYATDEQYLASGAEIKSREVIFEQADLLLCLNPLSGEELKKCTGKVLLGFYQVMNQKTLLPEWAASGASIFSLDMLPRTTRAQSMDVLSSQANIAGYKAVILAAELSPRYFPMFMTAAGSIPPAKVLILGAGVAGLQAIATAKRLGAVVEVFDTRPAVKEEVMSLGAKFVEVEGAADASKAGG